MKKNLIFLFALSYATHAFGGWIDANAMTAGDDATYAFGETATLNWADKKSAQIMELQALKVNQSNTEYPGNHFQYFGGIYNNSGTSNVGSLYMEHAYPTLFAKAASLTAEAASQSFYQALTITFLEPATTFGFKAESFSGDSQLVLFFDSNGQFVSHKEVGYSTAYSNPYTGLLLDYQYSFDLTGLDIASIVVGSWSSATYYYALQVEKANILPEPSSAALLLGSLALILIRRHTVRPGK